MSTDAGNQVGLCSTSETEAVREPVDGVQGSAWDQALCNLPGCGEELFMEWTFSRAIYSNDTAKMLADPATHHTSSWQVTCGAGHTILVPPPTAEDNYTFGECKCERMDPADDAYCGHGDLARLRAVAAHSASDPSRNG